MSNTRTPTPQDAELLAQVRELKAIALKATPGPWVKHGNWTIMEKQHDPRRNIRPRLFR